MRIKLKRIKTAYFAHTFVKIGDNLYLHYDLVEDDYYINSDSHLSICPVKVIDIEDDYIILETKFKYIKLIKETQSLKINGVFMKPFGKLFAKKDVKVTDKKTKQTKTVKKVNDNVGYVVGAVVGVGLAFLADKYL